MKKLFYILVALTINHLSFNISETNAQSWQWGKRAGSNFDESGPGGGNYENTIDMATDYNGNVYSLCRVYGKVSIGPTVNLDSDGNPLSTFGADEILLTSFDCNGKYRWSKVIGSATSATGENGVALRTDELGGVYVLGRYISYNYGSPLKPLNVATDTILKADNRCIFLVKYDTSGNYKWIRTPEPDTMGFVFSRTPAVFSSLPIEMGINQENDICALLYLRPGAFANGAYVVTDPGMTYHMLVYDRFGTFKKGYKMDMTSYTGNYNSGYNSMKMSIDKKTNKFYFAGGLNKGSSGFEDTLTLGGTFLRNSGYISRFDDKGKMEWLKVNAGGIYRGTYVSSRPIIDKYSNVYISGNGSHGDSFLGYKFNNLTSTTPVTYLMKLDDDGNRIWTKTSANQYVMPGGNGLSLSGNTIGFRGMFVGKIQWGTYNFIWSTGATYIPYFIRFNSMTGEIFGADTIATKIEENGPNPFKDFLTVDRFSNFYLGGGFKSDNTMKVGSNSLISAGGKTDIYLAKHGRNNCDCIVAPTASYSVSTPTGSLSSSFTFGGTSPADSVVWYFGDSTEARGTTATHTFKSKGTYNVCVVVYNRCGSDVNCKDVTVGTNSVNETFISNVKIYPNPANDFLYIDGLQSHTELSLTNIVGQEVKHLSTQKNKEQISIGELPSGMYLLHLKTAAGEVYTTKIVKE